MYTPHQSYYETASYARRMKLLSLICLVLQNTALVLLMRYTRSSHNGSGKMYFSTTTVVLMEVVKIVSCLVILSYSHGVSQTRRMISVAMLKQRSELLKMLVPAFLYAIQNNLLFVAITYLDAVTFQVTYQLKILTTAMFTVIMFGRKFSALKWLAMILLTIGVALVQMPTSSSSYSSSSASSEDNVIRRRHKINEPPPSSSSTISSPTPSTPSITPNNNQTSTISDPSGFLGLGSVLLACCSSGFAGVYFEKIIKTMDSNLWIRNIQLGFFSLIFSLVACIAADGRAIQQLGFFHGYNGSVVMVIFLQAAGGLVVALVMKHADNILKAFATSISIILSMLLSIMWLGFRPTFAFSLGTLFVMLSVYLYGMPDGSVAAATGASVGGHDKQSSPIIEDDVDVGKKSLLFSRQKLEPILPLSSSSRFK